MEPRALCAADLSSTGTAEFVDPHSMTDTLLAAKDYVCTDRFAMEGGSFDAALPKLETGDEAEFVDLGTLVGLPCVSDSVDRALETGVSQTEGAAEGYPGASTSDRSLLRPSDGEQVGAPDLVTPSQSGELSRFHPLATADTVSRTSAAQSSAILSGPIAASTVERLRFPSAVFIDVGTVVDTSPAQRKLQPALAQSSTTDRLNSTTFVASQDVLSYFSGGEETTTTVRRQRECDASLPARQSIIARRLSLRSAMTTPRQPSEIPPSPSDTSAWRSRLPDDAAGDSLTTPGQTSPQGNANGAPERRKPYEPGDKLPPLGIEANTSAFRLQQGNQGVWQAAALLPPSEPTITGTIVHTEEVVVMPQEEDADRHTDSSRRTWLASLSYSIVLGCAAPILADQFNKKTQTNQPRNSLHRTVSWQPESDIVD